MPASQNNLRRIVLCGFMGAGKTAVGAALAQRLRWQFQDLDAAIVRVAGKSVPRIFAEDGEPAFRNMEADALSAALRRNDLIIALGGGALERETNWQILIASTHTLTVYLQAPAEELRRRCEEQALQSEAAARPLLSTLDEFQARLTRREPRYRDCAQITISTVRKTAEQIAAELHQLLSAHLT